MKVFHNIYNNLIKIENIFLAWEEFKLGKTKKKDVIIFERHLEDNLFDLRRDLANKTYRHSGYKYFKIIDPKARDIHKASIRDRIVHHLVSSELEKIYEPMFIAHSYSSRKNKGTHRAVKSLVSFSRKLSRNNTRNFYALKCDVRKFFDSVDHEILLRILKRKIKDHDFLRLLEEIVTSFNNKGIPLGNLTSQYFANIYLNELDYFIKHNLRVKYYLRYADDFLILSEDKKYLENLILRIDNFLKVDLSLCLHSGKVKIVKCFWGIDFVGYIVLPYYILLRTKTKNRILKKIKKLKDDFDLQKIGLQDFGASFNSYLGLLKHCDSYNFKRLILLRPAFASATADKPAGLRRINPL